MAKVEASHRLRQAIVSNDLALVKRILTNHPACLQNPDLDDKSNTSLHLAARLGFEEIAEYLIGLGHDRSVETTDYIYSSTIDNLGTSINTDGQAPLHLAASFSQIALVELLCKTFPKTVNRRDRRLQTPLHLAAAAHLNPETKLLGLQQARNAARTSDEGSAVEVLLAHGADITAKDYMGNTCLHKASAWGNLKALRVLIHAGADPVASNFHGWTPQYYSVTVQAEVYYKNLVAEKQKEFLKQAKAEENAKALNQRRKKGGGGGAVRLVPSGEEDGSGSTSTSTSTSSRTISARNSSERQHGTIGSTPRGLALVRGGPPREV